MRVRLFVGNLPYDTTEAELREHFSPVGPLSYVTIPIDRESGKPRGFAFIEFNDRGQADEAIRRFNNQPFKGRSIAVNEARAREDRPRAEAPSRAYRPSSEPERTPQPPPPGERASHFGPDASPQRSRSKEKKGPRSERVPKGPMRELVRGQFFGGDDDDSFDDDLSGENFASRVSDSEGDDNA
jgi:RNA recognition motif-containing protein